MAILGSLVESVLISHAGAGRASAGINLITLSHSLPATNPEIVETHLVSLENVTAGDGATNHIPFGVGGNASILTVGWQSGHNSSISIGITTARVIARVYYSTVR